VMKFVNEIGELTKRKNIQIQLTDMAVDWFIENGYDKNFGARPMKRLIEREIKVPLSRYIIFGYNGENVEGKSILIDVIDDKITILVSERVAIEEKIEETA
ncbi:MAG: hypothetical protein WC284_16790, partial [Candidimonas sp.]